MKPLDGKLVIRIPETDKRKLERFARKKGKEMGVQLTKSGAARMLIQRALAEL